MTELTHFQAFAESGSAVMGFWTIAAKFYPNAANLKILPHPPASQLIFNVREKPPTEIRKAALYFEYLATRSANHDFTKKQLSELSRTSFVPLENSTIIAPKDCYVGTPVASFHSKLFTFVDFGNHGNSFLVECQAKKNPIPEDMAKVLVYNPKKFLEAVGSKALYVPLSYLQNWPQTKCDIDTCVSYANFSTIVQVYLLALWRN